MDTPSFRRKLFRCDSTRLRVEISLILILHIENGE
jgi:hypothetical protein